MMKTIFAENNPQGNSIDVSTSTGYMLHHTPIYQIPPNFYLIPYSFTNRLNIYSSLSLQLFSIHFFNIAFMPPLKNARWYSASLLFQYLIRYLYHVAQCIVSCIKISVFFYELKNLNKHLLS